MTFWNRPRLTVRLVRSRDNRELLTRDIKVGSSWLVGYQLGCSCSLFYGGFFSSTSPLDHSVCTIMSAAQVALHLRGLEGGGALRLRDGRFRRRREAEQGGPQEGAAGKDRTQRRGTQEPLPRPVGARRAAPVAAVPRARRHRLRRRRQRAPDRRVLRGRAGRAAAQVQGRRGRSFNKCK